MISQCVASPHFLGGTNAVRSSSTWRGVVPVVRPRRCATRKTCVSTASASALKAAAMTTLAVLRPTPASDSRCFAFVRHAPAETLHDVARAAR